MSGLCLTLSHVGRGKIFMTAVYICVAYGYYLRVNKGFWVECQSLIDGIHIGKYERWDPHVNPVYETLALNLGSDRLDRKSVDQSQ